MKLARSIHSCMSLVALLTSVAWPTAAHAQSSSSSVHADFDGDGFDDLAIGIPKEDLAGGADCGAVQVIYGTAAGLRSTDSQFWSQSASGVSGGPEPFDNFGDSLAAGDFNADGFADLAIGVPGEDFTVVNVGAVNVLYGSASGLTTTGNQFWSQDSSDVRGSGEFNDLFGSIVRAGDFNDDGFADLAISVFGEDEGSTLDAGAVAVLYGSASRLTAAGNQYWSQASSGINGGVEQFDHFGGALAVSDFNGDGRDDLAIGVSSEDIGDLVDAGAVNVVYGSTVGLSATGNQFWSQGSTGISGGAESFDNFGWSLAAADFNRDGFGDLAVGVLAERLGGFNAIGGIPSAGAVNVIYGSSARLASAGNQFWTQDSTDIADSAEFGDSFGRSLTSGDFNGDGFGDLAVGVDETVNFAITANRDGAVQVIYGSAARLSANGSQFWHQDRAGIAGTVEGGDRFGAQLTAADFDGDGIVDLAVSVPGEDIDGIRNAGGVHVIYGDRPFGLSATGSQMWHQNATGISGGAEQDDEFGGRI